MKGNARAAIAIGAGYVLGRRRKFRAAVLLAAAAAAGSTPVGGMVLKRGAKLLGSADVLGKAIGVLPPEVADLVDTVRGDLVPAGKAAVTTAASSRVNALTDALHERAELVRDPGAAVGDAAGEAKRGTDEVTTRTRRGADEVTSKAKRKSRWAKRAEDDDEPAGLDEEDAAPDEDDAAEDEEDTAEDEDRDEEDDRDEPVTRVRRTATRRRAPVTRGRR